MASLIVMLCSWTFNALTHSCTFANAIHHLIRNLVGMARAAREHIVNVRFVLENFLTPFAHRREIFPELLEQLFLEIAVASSAFYECFAHFRDFTFGRDQRIEFNNR